MIIYRPKQTGGTQRRGAAVVELVILLPFLALAFTAALDFARIFNATQILTDCAYSGALYASNTAQTSSSVDSTQAAKNAACADGVSLSPSLQPENVTVIVNATTVTVTVDYDFTMLTPLLSPSGLVHLQRSVTLKLAPVPGN